MKKVEEVVTIYSTGGNYHGPTISVKIYILENDNATSTRCLYISMIFLEHTCRLGNTHHSLLALVPFLIAAVERIGWRDNLTSTSVWLSSPRQELDGLPSCWKRQGKCFHTRNKVSPTQLCMWSNWCHITTLGEWVDMLKNKNLKR